jgi:hypothetical protein
MWISRSRSINLAFSLRPGTVVWNSYLQSLDKTDDRFYIGFAAPEDWNHSSAIDFNDNNQVLTWFQATFAGWAPINVNRLYGEYNGLLLR